MEHLVLPKDPVSPLDKVPYVCTESYDQGPFLEYAEREKKPWTVPRGEGTPLLGYGGYQALYPTPPREQEEFFQTWFFFGFIYMLLRDNFNEEDFIQRDGVEEGQIFVTTAKFIPLAQTSMNQSRGNDPAERARRYLYLNKSLKLMWSMLQHTHADFDPRIKFSIASIGELVAAACNLGLAYMQKTQSAPIGPAEWATGFYSERIIKEMISFGWCPSDIAKCIDELSTIQGLHLLSKMKKSVVTRNHVNCTKEFCTAYQINLSSYQLLHREENCKCSILNLDQKAVVAALDKGKLPLLKIRLSNQGLEKLEVDVIESEEDTPYVALSHVWADGLGNPFDNGLQRCQLRFMYEVASSLFQKLKNQATPNEQRSQLMNMMRSMMQAKGQAWLPQSGGETDESILIWCDTLCCPVRPLEDKMKALAQMRRTYEQASHVLVLDAGIQCYDSRELHAVEQVYRIITSSWMRRLWTLQEGALAKMLWFQFKEGPLLLNDLLFQVAKEFPKDLRYWTLYFDIWGCLGSLKQPLRTKIEEFTPPKYSLSFLDMALRNRSTSVASDEALCEAVLMDLDLEAVQVIPETVEDRMVKMWEMVDTKGGGIPQKIVFLDGKRLETKGWRWAPRTFLGNRETFTTPKVRTLHLNDTVLGRISQNGLLVTFPGFRLKLTTHDDGLPQNPWLDPILRMPERSLRFRGDDRRWYDIILKSRNPIEIVTKGKESTWAKERILTDLIQQDSHAVIYTAEMEYDSKKTVGYQVEGTLEGTEAAREGILVRIGEEKDSVISVFHEHHVVVATASPLMQTVLDAAERLAQELRKDHVTKALVDELHDKSSETYSAAVTKVKAKAREITKKALEDPHLATTVKLQLGGEYAVDGFWNVVTDWFGQDVLGTKLPPDQRWCVD